MNLPKNPVNQIIEKRDPFGLGLTFRIRREGHDKSQSTYVNDFLMSRKVSLQGARKHAEDRVTKIFEEEMVEFKKETERIKIVAQKTDELKSVKSQPAKSAKNKNIKKEKKSDDTVDPIPPTLDLTMAGLLVSDKEFKEFLENQSAEGKESIPRMEERQAIATVASWKSDDKENSMPKGGHFKDQNLIDRIFKPLGIISIEGDSEDEVLFVPRLFLVNLEELKTLDHLDLSLRENLPVKRFIDPSEDSEEYLKCSEIVLRHGKIYDEEFKIITKKFNEKFEDVDQEELKSEEFRSSEKFTNESERLNLDVQILELKHKTAYKSELFERGIGETPFFGILFRVALSRWIMNESKKLEKIYKARTGFLSLT